MIILCAFIFSGCSSDPLNHLIDPASSDKYEVIYDYAEQAYYLKNKTTGDIIDLVRSPLFGMFSNEDHVKSYYLDYPNLYYSISETKSYINRVGTYNSSYTKVSIVKVNLKTFKEEIIFEKITDKGRSVLGIEYEVGESWEFLQYHDRFFVNENSIFFVYNHRIIEVERKSCKAQTLNIDASEKIAFDGQYIYYIDKNSVLTKYDTTSELTISFNKIIAYDFCIDKQSIYYISIRDGYQVYQCSLDGDRCKKIASDAALAISCNETDLTIILKGTGEQIVIAK